MHVLPESDTSGSDTSGFTAWIIITYFPQATANVIKCDVIIITTAGDERNCVLRVVPTQNNYENGPITIGHVAEKHCYFSTISIGRRSLHPPTGKNRQLVFVTLATHYIKWGTNGSQTCLSAAKDVSHMTHVLENMGSIQLVMIQTVALFAFTVV